MNIGLSTSVVAPQPARDAGTSDLLNSVGDLRQFLAGSGASAPAVIGQSATMRRVFLDAVRFAHSTAPVLLTGESGTGKEVIASLIHRTSDRADQPYVCVNCAALPEQLLEAELFGHERGAFTGATERRIGRFEHAAGGTLLLDEISEIPIHLQAKLLRVLEEEEFQRIGSNDNLPLDVRVIATSNRCLQEEIAADRFRADLYYRLNVLQLQLPPLRERREDIAELVQHFVQQYGHEAPQPIDKVHPDAMRQLRQYDWPGNVRQLRNVIRRACLLANSPVLQADDLPSLPPPVSPQPDLYDLPLAEVEQHLIRHALNRCEGNKTAAARHLGITVRTLHNWIKRFPDLENPRS